FGHAPSRMLGIIVQEIKRLSFIFLFQRNCQSVALPFHVSLEIASLIDPAKQQVAQEIEMIARIWLWRRIIRYAFLRGPFIDDLQTHQHNGQISEPSQEIIHSFLRKSSESVVS